MMKASRVNRGSRGEERWRPGGLSGDEERESRWVTFLLKRTHFTYTKKETYERKSRRRRDNKAECVGLVCSG